ncbi:MAG: hypothetical protein ACYC0V_01610 [Armatimonadota bacterium]
MKNRAARRAARQSKVAIIIAVIVFAVLMNIVIALRDPSESRLNAVVAQAAASADSNAAEKGLSVK